MLGDREAAVCRELTKKFETVRRGSLSKLAAEFADEPTPRGEIVLLVGPPGQNAEIDAGDLDEKLREALTKHSVKDAAAVVSAQTGVPRRKVYARAIELAAEK